MKNLQFHPQKIIILIENIDNEAYRKSRTTPCAEKIQIIAELISDMDG